MKEKEKYKRNPLAGDSTGTGLIKEDLEKRIENNFVDDIKSLTDQRVMEVMKIQPDSKDPKTYFNMKMEQAKLGIIYVRDREIMDRINQGQQIRVINFITSDMEQRKQYIKIAMPALIPDKIES